MVKCAVNPTMGEQPGSKLPKKAPGQKKKVLVAGEAPRNAGSNHCSQ